MPCRFSLEIECCQKLMVVPHYMFFQNLKKLVISSCPSLGGMQPCLPPLLEELILEADLGCLSDSLMPVSHNNSHSNLKSFRIQFATHVTSSLAFL
ncbi:hypothetical protein AQUCO_03000090v1 [Aquilegia coerulea]|uniref:Uncharacterized protein n=1 Tax=Aquilegia coerulea TaxID=218851 RepID=A0A2G5D163_AQUCA|nr:hypothetical protein AQUCO_03000090v1 [Aquilegia coerulea]